jgi:hypothetical protein
LAGGTLGVCLEFITSRAEFGCLVTLIQASHARSQPRCRLRHHIGSHTALCHDALCQTRQAVNAPSPIHTTRWHLCCHRCQRTKERQHRQIVLLRIYTALPVYQSQPWRRITAKPARSTHAGAPWL